MQVGRGQWTPGRASGPSVSPLRATVAARRVAPRPGDPLHPRSDTHGAMISEVDQAIEALVRREALNGSRVEVLFDAPTRDWVARRNAPTLDVYLYDIREDTSRRQIASEPVRDPVTGIASGHRMPPRRYKLSYLVTAWTQRPEDEHRLLSACLAAFVRNEIIPPDLLGGSLAGSVIPVILQVAAPMGQDRSIADVWSAMGGELKPSLDLVAIAPLDATYSWPAAKPVLEPLSLGMASGDAAERVVARPSRLAAAAHAPLGPGEPAIQDETITAIGRHAAAEKRKGKPGAEDAPSGGRVMHIRGISRP